MTSSHKVLIVDDSADIQELILCLLRVQQGFTLRQAWDGVEALETLESWMPDLILTDVLMPRMDGIQLLRQIKQQERLIDIPVIVMTASDRGADRAAELGASLVLRKPIDFVELANAIRKLIAGQAAFCASISSDEDG